MAVFPRSLIRHPAIRAFLGGVIAGSLPLLFPSGLNLEYEHVWIASILVVLFWPLTTLTKPTGISPRSYTHQIGSWILQPISLLIGLALPGALIFAAKLSPCSPSGYGQWILLQALPAVFVAAAFRQLLFFASNGESSAWRRTLFFWGIGIAASLLWLGVKLWTMPQKRTVDLFWGFIHGPLYDERIWLHPDIWKVRGAQLSLAIAAGLAALTVPSHRKAYGKNPYQRLVWVLPPFVTWLTLSLMTWLSPVTGHGLTLLKRQFPKSHIGEGFTIFHDMDEASLTKLSREAGFHVNDLKAKLQLAEYPHVDVFAYPNARVKKLWFGGGATDVTDVRNAGIHITVGRRITGRHPTLRHELVHALTSRVAFHGLGFHPNMALTEGLAVALSPDANLFASISLDEAAAELLSSGRVPDPAALFNPWTFWLSSGPRAYTTMGSLIKYLINTEGVSPVLEFYRGKSWQDMFPANKGDVVAGWRKFLDQTARPRLAAKMQARTMFRSRGVAFDVCPHSFADRMAANPSVEDLQEMAVATNDPSYLLMASRRQARDAFDERDPDARRERMGKLLEGLLADRTWPPVDEESIEFQILASDVMRLIASGRSGSKSDPLARLSVLNEQHPLPPPLARHVMIRQLLDQFVATKQLDQERSQAWRNYLAGWSGLPTPAVQNEKSRAREPWVLVYLRVRAAFNNGDRPEATGYKAEELSSIRPDPVLAAGDPSFTFEWYRNLAELLERDGKSQLASAAWATAAENSPNATAQECMLESKQMIDGI